MIYVEPLTSEHGQPTCRLRADTAGELHQFAVNHHLSDFEPNPTDPAGGTYRLSADERQRAIQGGATDATWLHVHQHLNQPPDANALAAPPDVHPNGPDSPARTNRVIAVLIVAGVVSVFGLVAMSQVAAMVSHLGGTDAKGSPLSIPDAQRQIDQVLAAGAPGTPAVHTVADARDCARGTGGRLVSTVTRPDALNALVGVDEQLQAHGWQLTRSQGKTGDVTASYVSADGHANVQVAAADHTGMRPHFTLTTTLGCS